MDKFSESNSDRYLESWIECKNEGENNSTMKTSNDLAIALLILHVHCISFLYYLLLLNRPPKKDLLGKGLPSMIESGSGSS